MAGREGFAAFMTMNAFGAAGAAVSSDRRPDAGVYFQGTSVPRLRYYSAGAARCRQAVGAYVPLPARLTRPLPAVFNPGPDGQLCR